MRKVFYPKSVAVVGVSDKETNLGKNIIHNLVDFNFDGIVYPVGPQGGIIATRRIYKSLTDIPDHVDLAVILVPARFVPDVMEECGQKGIKSVVIESAGFREYSEQGRKIEEDVVAIAKKYDIRFVGPNCIGIINMENGFSIPFPRLVPFIRKGQVSIISQSGGVGMSIMNHMAGTGIGLNKFISAGNMLNIDAEDLLEYLIEDQGTRIIFVYLESIRDGRRLMDIAKTSAKPILVFKSNIGRLGKNIAASHTASLSSDDRVVDAAFQQCGITRIHDVTTLSDYMQTLRLPGLKGKRLAIISRSGGHAIIAADACEITGFDLADFPESFIKDIEKHFRASVIKLTNPLDLGDLFDGEVYVRIVKETLAQDNVDGIVFLHTSGEKTERDTTRYLVSSLEQLSRETGKPVALYISSNASEMLELRKEFEFPLFTQIVEMFRALRLSYDHSVMIRKGSEADVEQDLFTVEKQQVEKIISAALKEKRDLLLDEAFQVLTAYGIPAVEGARAVTAEEARTQADKLGYPVVMKVISNDISHKSDVGGVKLNLQDADSVDAGFVEMKKQIEKACPNAEFDGVLIQPMMTGGRELILGARQDDQFGPVILIGLGGVFVEIFEKASLRVAPVTRVEAIDMINELHGARILMGVRGEKRYDIDSIIDAILRLSRLMVDFPQIRELDINPLRIYHDGGGSLALDARIIL